MCSIDRDEWKKEKLKDRDDDATADQLVRYRRLLDKERETKLKASAERKESESKEKKKKKRKHHDDDGDKEKRKKKKKRSSDDESRDKSVSSLVISSDAFLTLMANCKHLG